MPGLIRRSDIDEVRARMNMADVVGDFVTLKSAGVGSLKGLCPFHEERSPSFHVRPQVGFYHCFGCGEGGDVFSFLQKMDHVTFQEAVERMAARIGYELHYEDGGQASDHGNRARLLAANAAAEMFFRAQLATPGRADRPRLLGARGFDQAAADQFGIGFAPKSFEALGDALKAQGFTEPELRRRPAEHRRSRQQLRPVPRPADLADPRYHRPDRRFGARKLLDDEQDKGPKYLNTPETPIYHKSRCSTGSILPGATSPRASRSSSSRATPTSWPATSRASPPPWPPAAPVSASTTSRSSAGCSAIRQRGHLGPRPGHVHLRSG